MHNRNVRTRSGPRGSSLNNLFLCVLLFYKKIDVSRGTLLIKEVNMNERFMLEAFKQAK